MSSNPIRLSLKTGVWLASAGAALLLSHTVAAQDDPDVTDAQSAGQADGQAEGQADAQPAPPPRRSERINLSVTVPKPEADLLLEQDCEREADAGRVAGEIVVCRQLGEASDGSWNKEEWEQEYARRTQGEQPINTFGIPNHGNPIGFGSPPPPALMIDIEALPEAPEGSDADRISRGLPPLGRDPELSPEEIARRRRALGLNAPPVTGD